MDHQSILLTLTQSLHMVALAPCILVFFYLLATTQHPTLIIIPILFFAALAASLVAPMVPAFYTHSPSDYIVHLFTLSESLLCVLSYLLIMQFFLNRIPPVYYWSVLIIPFLVAFPAIFGIWNNNDVCLSIDICIQSDIFLKISYVITGGLVMMLITATLARMSWHLDMNPTNRSHKYWLIIAIISLNIYLFALELGNAAEWVGGDAYLFAKVLIKLTFVYLVLTSLFRVYSEAFAVDEAFQVSYHRMPLREDEKKIATQIISLMENDKVFLEMGFGRNQFADKLGVSEHQLSRIINLRFQKSVTDFINEYRTQEAKELLCNSNSQITNIAFDVGFNSIASFNRVFKQLVDCTPSQYREQYKL